MDFELSDDRRMLQDGLRRYLRDVYTHAARVTAADSAKGFTAEIWGGLAEMGVVGALFAEAQGGFGGDGFDIALVFEELGRAGAVDPLIDTGILGGGLLAELGGHDDLVGGVIDGSIHLALAHGEPGGRYDPTHVRARAEALDGGWALAGRKAVVVNAPAADHVLVTARTSGGAGDAHGISLFLAPGDALAARPYPVVGGGRAAELTLDGLRLPGDALVGPEGCAWPALARAQARATLAISAEALGLMESIRALTTDYLRTRKQFGRPIGTFQVIQHRMADMLIEIEQARSAVVNLAGHVDAEPALRDRHVSATKNLVGEVARLVVEEGIQLHGGIGMTAEYELAHLARRLAMVDHRFGDALHHLERFIALTAA